MAPPAAGGFDLSGFDVGATPNTDAANGDVPETSTEALTETREELEAKLEAAMAAEDFDLCEELNAKIEALPPS